RRPRGQPGRQTPRSDTGATLHMTVETSTWATKKGLAQMLKGGVIMDVVTPDQSKIAEDAGAVAVMALERVPADIRAAGGVARMSDPPMIAGLMAAVTIPVMAKARTGHFAEAQALEALLVDSIAAPALQPGAQAVCARPGISRSKAPPRIADALVRPTTHCYNPGSIAEVSQGLAAPRRGVPMEATPEQDRLAVRGW